MKIHSDNNGVTVTAVQVLQDGTDVQGHVYQVAAGTCTLTVEFQRGPVTESGVNGVTNEALLALVAHRLLHLNGKFPCRENALAITKVQEALHWLEARTRDRIARSVEGRNLA